MLPRWRGAAPIHRAILAGDAETGVTIMQMDAGLDTGAMLLKAACRSHRRRRLEAARRAGGVGLRTDRAGAGGLAEGRLTPEPQPSEGVTYAAKLSRDDGRLDWTQPADFIERQVRALNPWPGVWFDLGKERIKVLAAEPAPETPGAAPGTLLDGNLTVACADGAVRLTRVQRPGKAAVDGAAFLRGFNLAVGSVLAAS